MLQPLKAVFSVLDADDNEVFQATFTMMGMETGTVRLSADEESDTGEAV
jgi:hypothetical protein